jgi:hypothetical protein
MRHSQILPALSIQNSFLVACMLSACSGNELLLCIVSWFMERSFILPDDIVACVVMEQM